MFISSFCSNSLIWVLVSCLSLLVPCIFFFISLCIAFTSSFILKLYSTISVSILWAFLWESWLPVSSTLHPIGWLSLHCLILFLELWSALSFGPYFFVLVQLLHCKRQRLRYSPGWDNPCHCLVLLSVGEASEREQCCLLGSWPDFSHFLRYPQTNWALLLLILGWMGSYMF